jgi:amino acid adenylation domain-containing protein
MLIENFEKQVNQTPGNIAVKTGKQSYSYEQLNQYANRIAHLIEKNRPGQTGIETVGLLLDHGVDMIAAILGTLKSGKAYVPISPAYPRNRIFYMLTHSESSLIITHSKYESKIKEWTRENKTCFFSIPSAYETESTPGTNPYTYLYQQPKAGGERLAYIMYTSGSTGKPKGVMQNHQNVMYYIKNWTQRFSISSSDRMTLFSSFCHDGSVQDMFAALLNGAALYPFDIKIRETHVKLSRFLIEEKITIWHSVPSLYNFFVNTLTGEERFDDLRFILLGGEPLREYEINMFKKFFPKSILANVYGQTESSVNSIWLIHPGETLDSFIIGKPLDNTRIFVVDEKGDEVDVLKIGEILAASPSISPGYWKDADASEQVFAQDPEFGRLYWTGDLGRLLPDGNIEYAGRKDFQVKIRGFRVELGEIESHLLKHEAVKEAVVIARKGENRDNNLYAYATAVKELDLKELREYLRQELPDYMIPLYFVQLDKMPLTSSGKIDRRALAALKTNHLMLKRTYVKPKTDMEKIIANTWKEVLKVEEVGLNDNFFDLGGNSFDILKVHDLLEKMVKKDIVVAKMFAYPTVSTLALYLNEGKSEEKQPVKQILPAQYDEITRAKDRFKQRARMRHEPGT